MDSPFDTSSIDDPWELMDPGAYYDALQRDAWERLRASFVTQCEFEHTVEYLETWLPGDGMVLDGGGGTGRYAVWMARRGHAVSIADLSRSQLGRARAKARENDCADAISTVQADITSLPYATASFDAVCGLGGALSHIVDRDQRERAVEELKRVGTPGAPVILSVGGRLAYLASNIRADIEESYPLLPAIARDGDLTRDLLEEHLESPAYTSAHFFRADELESLLAGAGLEVELVAGLEGIASLYPERIEDASEDAKAAVRTIVREQLEDRVAADLSSHILAVATIPK